MQQRTLQDAKPGFFLRLTAVEGCADPHVARLAELGMVEGAGLEIIHNSTGTPLILEINGTKLCIDRSLAAHFWVSDEVGA